MVLKDYLRGLIKKRNQGIDVNEDIFTLYRIFTKHKIVDLAQKIREENEKEGEHVATEIKKENRNKEGDGRNEK